MLDGFWDNVVRYIRYFVTTMLGVILTAPASLGSLAKSPVTVIVILGLLAGGFVFLILTLRAMLGLSTII
ncbi:DUF751 family protein [Richelia intracellularis]|nr:DUF751 family protein [Richelia intracellularis]HAE05620.1 DUF751 domain-containing protein [Richelia sp.]